MSLKSLKLLPKNQFLWIIPVRVERFVSFQFGKRNFTPEFYAILIDKKESQCPYEICVHGMGEKNEWYCTKASVFRSLFLILLILITVQIGFNLTVQQAAFTFVYRWVQVSQNLYSGTTNTVQTTPTVPLRLEQSTTIVNNVTYVCNNGTANSTGGFFTPMPRNSLAAR